MFICNKCNCGKEGCGGASKKQLATLQKEVSAMSVSSRMQLLFVLSEKNHCVCDLTGHTGMSQSLVSHHLADMVQSGLVENKKIGKFKEYTLTTKGKNAIKALRLLMGKEVE